MFILAPQSWLRLLVGAAVLIHSLVSHGSGECGEKKPYLVHHGWYTLTTQHAYKDHDSAFKHRFCYPDACCFTSLTLRYGRFTACQVLVTSRAKPLSGEDEIRLLRRPYNTLIAKPWPFARNFYICLYDVSYRTCFCICVNF